jgi:hypothetical protein
MNVAEIHHQTCPFQTKNDHEDNTNLSKKKHLHQQSPRFTPCFLTEKQSSHVWLRLRLSPMTTQQKGLNRRSGKRLR